jgi:translation elongation factor EF-Ts
LIFRTSHETMEAEAVLKAGRIKTRLTPQPREAREDCSSALALSSKDGDRAEELLHQNGLSPHKAGRLGKDGTWIPKK